MGDHTAESTDPRIQADVYVTADATGDKGASAALIARSDARLGHLAEGTRGAADVKGGRASFRRWNVHTTLAANVALAARVKVGSFLGPSFETASDTVGLLALGLENFVGLFTGEGQAITGGDISAMRRMTPFASLPYWRFLIDGVVVPKMKEAVK
jgi:hypothetical protein